MTDAQETPMTTTDPTTKLADQIRYAWRDTADPTVIGLVQALSPHAIEMLAITAAKAATEHLDQQPTPLAVGDRVRIVRPVMADGWRVGRLAVGDVGTVIIGTDEDGDIRFRRDGTNSRQYVAAANVERIEDQS